jgi:predicted deacylase
MPKAPDRLDVGEWDGVRIAPGERRSVDLRVSESYAGTSLGIPVHVWRAPEPGPVVFVTAAVHGDELNGAGAVRRLILDELFELRCGALILVPVINIFGFERHSRYLPDRRDLNRSFPGSPEGSLASRLASVVYREIVGRADFGIDLHTAAVRRTNFPNVRANMRDERVADLALKFGAELNLHGVGPKGSFRRAACAAGVPTIILEAGEVWKVEPAVVDYTIRGVWNVLANLGMIDGPAVMPERQTVADRSTWVRARRGGFMRFHVAPGDVVEEGQPVATSSSLVGREMDVVHAPVAGVVLGMTTIPAAAPGDPICHIAYREDGKIRRIEKAVEAPRDDLVERIRADLAAKMMVWEPEDR